MTRYGYGEMCKDHGYWNCIVCLSGGGGIYVYPYGCYTCGFNPCQCDGWYCWWCGKEPCECEEEEEDVACVECYCLPCECATGGWGGGGYAGNDPPPYNPSNPPATNPYLSKVEGYANNIKATLSQSLTITILTKANFSVGTPNPGLYAQLKCTPAQLYNTSPLDIIIKTGLNDRQLQFVIAHEYLAHLRWFDISRLAGNQTILSMMNEELCLCLGLDINKGQHEYTSRRMDDYEALLRDLFPGESEEFYRYGKWGGGLIETEAFKDLGEAERNAILRYLNKNKL